MVSRFQSLSHRHNVASIGLFFINIFMDIFLISSLLWYLNFINLRVEQDWQQISFFILLFKLLDITLSSIIMCYTSALCAYREIFQVRAFLSILIFKNVNETAIVIGLLKISSIIVLLLSNDFSRFIHFEYPLAFQWLYHVAWSETITRMVALTFLSV